MSHVKLLLETRFGPQLTDPWLNYITKKKLSMVFEVILILVVAYHNHKIY